MAASDATAQCSAVNGSPLNNSESNRSNLNDMRSIARSTHAERNKKGRMPQRLRRPSLAFAIRNRVLASYSTSSSFVAPGRDRARRSPRSPRSPIADRRRRPRSCDMSMSTFSPFSVFELLLLIGGQLGQHLLVDVSPEAPRTSSPRLLVATDPGRDSFAHRFAATLVANFLQLRSSGRP